MSKSVEKMLEEMAARSSGGNSLWVGIYTCYGKSDVRRLWDVKVDDCSSSGESLADAVKQAYAEMKRRNRAEKARKK
jgi:hypothetical protein